MLYFIYRLLIVFARLPVSPVSIPRPSSNSRMAIIIVKILPIFLVRVVKFDTFDARSAMAIKVIAIPSAYRPKSMIPCFVLV